MAAILPRVFSPIHVHIYKDRGGKENETEKTNNIYCLYENIFASKLYTSWDTIIDNI